jgi:hypothetical protein
MADFTNDPRFDHLFLQIASQTRGIEPILDTLFSFLRRQSDFFGDDEQGVQRAVDKVNEVLGKHSKLFLEEKKKERAKKEKELDDKKKREAKEKSVKKEEDVIELGEDGGFDISNSNAVEATTAADDSEPKVEKQSASTDTDTSTKEEDDSPPPLGNGGTTPNYTWTQTLSELSLSLPLPPNTRARDLSVAISKTHLKIALKSSPSTPIVDDSLTKPIIVDDSLWTIEDNSLVITLQKLNQMEWWEAPCLNDPKINLQKICPENSNLSDLDGETRQTVEKMMYDQRQKAMGLPTSEEEKKMEIIERFKRSHPEMDFSNAKIS